MKRTMEVKFRRIAGRWLAMYETKWRDEFGNLKFNAVVDLNEVCWG